MVIASTSAPQSALPWPRGRSRCRPTAKESRHRALRRKEWRRWRSSLLPLEIAEAAQERRALELNLREALASDQFQLYFQPLVDLRTGRVTTCEAGNIQIEACCNYGSPAGEPGDPRDIACFAACHYSCSSWPA